MVRAEIYDLVIEPSQRQPRPSRAWEEALFQFRCFKNISSRCDRRGVAPRRSYETGIMREKIDDPANIFLSSSPPSGGSRFVELDLDFGGSLGRLSATLRAFHAKLFPRLALN